MKNRVRTLGLVFVVLYDSYLDAHGVRRVSLALKSLNGLEEIVGHWKVISVFGHNTRHNSDSTHALTLISPEFKLPPRMSLVLFIHPGCEKYSTRYML
jgi:hypothetical protein